LANAPGGEDGFALISLSPPASINRGEATPRDVTLVLDVSGSMSGVKMNQARAAGRQLLQTLRPGDRFRLIDFSSDVHTFRDEFSSATPENLRAAQRYLDALEAQGSTNISGALREALGANRSAESVERAVSLVAGRIVDPVLTDVRIRADGDVRLSKTLPQQPVDLFAGQDLVLLTRYAGHGSARVIFEGRHGGERVRWSSTVDFPD